MAHKKKVVAKKEHMMPNGKMMKDEKMPMKPPKKMPMKHGGY